MMTITSPAGRRLAKAGHAYQPYHEPKPPMTPGDEAIHHHEAAERELIDAAMAVVEELMASRMHEQEGD